jgi:glycine/D-amino acid oxidase-like deaminating enzyme
VTIYSDHTPKQFDDPLPSSADVVVIGAGIAGICAALYLVQRGLKVVVCEKGRVAGEQSSRNWGWVRQHGRDPAELPIMMESNRIWQTLHKTVGQDLGFRQRGVLYLASSEKKMAARERWVDLAQEHQLTSVKLSAGEVAEKVPTTNSRWQGGVYTPSDGRAEPWVAVPAIAKAVNAFGAVICEDCAVRSLDTTDGNVSGVVTEHGHIQCERVVLAGGAWSSLFAANAGVRLPQLAVRSTAVRTDNIKDFFSGNAADEQLAWRRREDGGYTLALTDLTEHFIGPNSFKYFKPFVPAMLNEWDTYRLHAKWPEHYPDGWRTQRRWSPGEISPMERIRVLNPPPRQAAIQRIKKQFAKRFPTIADTPFTHTWAGLIDTMPDVVPVLDEVDTTPGLIVATGFSGHGFGIGPAAGKIVADLVQGKKSEHDLHRFRFSRFSDGSSIKLGPVW